MRDRRVELLTALVVLLAATMGVAVIAVDLAATEALSWVFCAMPCTPGLASASSLWASDMVEARDGARGGGNSVWVWTL